MRNQNQGDGYAEELLRSYRRVDASREGICRSLEDLREPHNLPPVLVKQVQAEESFPAEYMRALLSKHCPDNDRRLSDATTTASASHSRNCSVSFSSNHLDQTCPNPTLLRTLHLMSIDCAVVT
eukprot:Polyplicarium_translucidae@DN4193_c0_g1_i1.p1